MEAQYYKGGDIMACLTDKYVMMTAPDKDPKMAPIAGNPMARFLSIGDKITREEFENSIDVSNLKGKMFKATFFIAIKESENPDGKMTDEDIEELSKILGIKN